MNAKYIKIYVIAMLFVSTIALAVLYQNINTRSLVVNYLDVGQGDSALIVAPGNSKLIIDTGNDMSIISSLSKHIPFYDKTIEYVILTHPDIDHAGMYNQISPRYNVKNLVLSDILDFTKLVDIKNKNTNNVLMKASSTIIFDRNSKSSIIFKNTSMHKDFMGDNSNSIVSDFEYQGYEFIFTGDIDVETERILVSRGKFKNEFVKILKIAHHGSKTSSSELFLKALRPEYCILSVSKNNNYGHPDLDVINRLQKYCKNIYNTAKDGDITFKIEEGILEITTSK